MRKEPYSLDMGNKEDLVEDSHYQSTLNGNHLGEAPFKYDLCSFRNVCQRDPI